MLNKSGAADQEVGHHHDPIDRVAWDGVIDGSVAVVRHPVAWAVSLWSHWTWGGPRPRRSNARKRWFGPWSYRMFSGGMLDFICEGDLDRTLQRLAQRHPGYVTRLFQRYVRDVSHCLRHEELRTELSDFVAATSLEHPARERLLELCRTEAPQNVWSRGLVTLDRRTVQLLIDAEAEGIAKFGYRELPHGIAIR